jgi:hypothetical protein
VNRSPREIIATNGVGAMGFQLELPDGIMPGEPRSFKLESGGGRVEIKLGSNGYEPTFSAKAVEKFR